VVEEAVQKWEGLYKFSRHICMEKFKILCRVSEKWGVPLSPPSSPIPPPMVTRPTSYLMTNPYDYFTRTRSHDLLCMYKILFARCWYKDMHGPKDTGFIGFDLYIIYLPRMFSI